VLVEKNDPSLPGSLDGNNITEDTVTGLQWLDVTVSADRSFDDVVGNDGMNEFAPGGDFEGFRHATADELTGWNPGPQFDSLFINFGFTCTFHLRLQLDRDLRATTSFDPHRRRRSQFWMARASTFWLYFWLYFWRASGARLCWVGALCMSIGRDEAPANPEAGKNCPIRSLLGRKGLSGGTENAA
jgi:hypothetical protein